MQTFFRPFRAEQEVEFFSGPSGNFFGRNVIDFTEHYFEEEETIRLGDRPQHGA